jgi:hypothetical protein
MPVYPLIALIAFIRSITVEVAGVQTHPLIINGMVERLKSIKGIILVLVMDVSKA